MTNQRDTLIRFALLVCVGILGAAASPTPAMAQSQSRLPEDVPERRDAPAETTSSAREAERRAAALVDDPVISVDRTSPEERKRARAIFREGVVLHLDTLFARAAEKYQQALDIWPHPGFSYNLALHLPRQRALPRAAGESFTDGDEGPLSTRLGRTRARAWAAHLARD